MKALFIAALATSLLSSCQVKRGLLETPDFNRQESLFFVHSDLSGSPAGDHIFLDGVELQNFEELDQKGVKVKSGEHNIRIVSEDNKTKSKITYFAEDGQENHLFHCEGDGSFHWYKIKNAKERMNLDKIKDQVCFEDKD